MADKHILYEYAMSFLGTPYLWGGDGPIDGIDCSGLVIELLKSQGVLPRVYDSNAAGLFVDLAKRPGSVVAAKVDIGTLIFFGVESITHVGFALSDTLMLEAGGGDHTVVNRETAAAKNAFVRVRPINSRGDMRSTLNVDYKWENTWTRS